MGTKGTLPLAVIALTQKYKVRGDCTSLISNARWLDQRKFVSVGAIIPTFIEPACCRSASRMHDLYKWSVVFI